MVGGPDEPRGFFCKTCGHWHDGLPLDVGFPEPIYVDHMSPADRERFVETDRDFRRVQIDGEYHYYIRGVLEIRIHDVDDTFRYGVWSSLSEANYAAAREAYDRKIPAGPFYGWFSNRLGGYPETMNLKCKVQLRSDIRASIELEATDHPLSLEQQHGITLERVQAIVEPLLHQ